MLNDIGGVEQAVAARVRTTWMKFRELGGIFYTQGVSLVLGIRCVFAA